MFSQLRYKIEKNFKRSFEEGDITEEEMEEIIKRGAILVDVRSPQEYKEGHLNNAISIPEYEIKKKVQNILEDKNEMIIVYCSTGHRSKRGQKILQKLGYKNVYNLYGGISI